MFGRGCGRRGVERPRGGGRWSQLAAPVSEFLLMSVSVSLALATNSLEHTADHAAK